MERYQREAITTTVKAALGWRFPWSKARRDRVRAAQLFATAGVLELLERQQEPKNVMVALNIDGEEVRQSVMREIDEDEEGVAPHLIACDECERQLNQCDCDEELRYADEETA